MMPERMNIEPESARFHAGTRTCPGGIICNLLNILVFGGLSSAAGFPSGESFGSGIVHAFQMTSTAEVLNYIKFFFLARSNSGRKKGTKLDRRTRP